MPGRAIIIDITKRLEAFFSPCITLFWRGRYGTPPAAFYPDSISDRSLLRQFRSEAGLPRRSHVTIDEIDLVGVVAGRYGYSVETVGDSLE